MIEVAFFIGGYVTQLIATILLLKEVLKKQSVYGLSMDTQICFLLSTVSRAIWTRDTRLTETRLAHVELGGAVLTSLAACVLCHRLRGTNSKQATSKYSVWLLTAAAMVTAILWHPGRGLLSLQVLVAFTIYMETLALLPQLKVMHRLEDADAITGQYVALLVLSRLLRLVFWIALFLQGDRFIGLFLADLLHSFFTAHYLFIWVRKMRTQTFGLIYRV